MSPGIISAHLAPLNTALDRCHIIKMLFKIYHSRPKPPWPSLNASLSVSHNVFMTRFADNIRFSIICSKSMLTYFNIYTISIISIWMKTATLFFVLFLWNFGFLDIIIQYVETQYFRNCSRYIYINTINPSPSLYLTITRMCLNKKFFFFQLPEGI